MYTFQTLPYLIIKRIIFYHTQRPYDFFEYKWKRISPLLCLSQSWRLVALQSIEIYQMEFGNNIENDRMPEWPVNVELSTPLTSVASLLRALAITLYLPLHEFHADKFPTYYQFDSVFTLEINIYNGYQEPFDIETVQRNLALCVQYLQRIAPNVRDLKIYMYSCGDESRREYAKVYTELLHSLLSSFAKRRLIILQSSGLDLKNRDIPANLDGITYLKFVFSFLGKEFQLIRRLSKTLQVLKFGQYMQDDDFGGFLVDDITNEYVVYPNLRYLESPERTPDVSIKMCPAYPNAIPFPNLQTLVWKNIYCFSDDVLFRGNQHSLRSMDIYLTTHMVNLFKSNETFSVVNNYRNLRRVKVYLFGKHVKYFDLFSVISDMARNTEVLDFKFSNPNRIPCTMVIPQFGALESLKILDVACISFKLSDVIELLKLLPQLQELTCVIRKLDHLLMSMTPSKCIKHLETTYLPLSQRFKKLRVSGTDSEWTAKRTRSVLLIAVMCPSFDHLEILSREQPRRFSEHWDKMLGQRMYKDYKERLQSIRIDDWETLDDFD